MITRRGEAWLWVVQRATAAMLALFVLVHLATMIYAVRTGLTAANLLARTHASLAWPLFYALFALTASVHAAVGLRTIAGEWLAWRGRAADATAIAIALVLAAAGLRAVVAVAA